MSCVLHFAGVLTDTFTVCSEDPDCQPGQQPCHAVGLDLECQVEVLCGHGLEVGRLVEPGIAVPLAADPEAAVVQTPGESRPEIEHEVAVDGELPCLAVASRLPLACG